ncbi:MAG: FliM/FliN family flagellar motor switch protein [Verrucomicrobia bacterium]|nr:FliM/FliN family flagellar motor switch protein [Verrucomicrobiota bacterium]MBS0645566.1 FliM/FliN family flagellar motor switch protein [Verrucomicrobiota bacterium]
MKLNHINLTCQVHVGRAEIQADEYHQLRVGDILVLDQYVHDPWELSVEGAALFKVTPGLDGVRKAVSIQEVTQPNL